MTNNINKQIKEPSPSSYLWQSLNFTSRKESSLATACDGWHTVFSNMPGLLAEETLPCLPIRLHAC